MKIAIFGDSYGVNMPNPSKSWVDLISESYDVDNHCEGGSGLFYSFLQFVDHHTKYDKIIFLLTNPGRLWLRKCDVTKHVSNYDVASFWLSQARTLKDKNILESARSYFLNVKNDEFDSVVHNLMVEDIFDIRNDVLLIPCFTNSGISKYTNCLFNACAIDWQYYGIDYTLTQYNDYRHGHMNKLNNEILSNEILRYLKTNEFNLDNCIWVPDPDTPFEVYFGERK